MTDSQYRKYLEVTRVNAKVRYTGKARSDLLKLAGIVESLLNYVVHLEKKIKLLERKTTNGN